MIHSHDIHANMLLVLLFLSAALNIFEVLLDSLDESGLPRFTWTNQKKVQISHLNFLSGSWPHIKSCAYLLR